MRLLLVEPYYSGSHRAWADGYVQRSQHDVRLVTHPGRWWKWRMRGSAVTLAMSLESLDGWKPDLVVVSGMIDLAHLRTLARPFVGDVPMVLYLHETQLTYPNPAGVTVDDSYALTNWISALVADTVLFNSGYHRDVFFDKLGGLLRSFPDHRHENLVPRVRERSEVLALGVDLSWIPESPTTNPVPRILWNHRWEFDKNPETFADALEQLIEVGADFELILLGARSNRPPPALQRIRRVAPDRIVYDAEAPTGDYRRLLAGSDIVVSTAKQEFFGVSIVEAVAAGARLVLPDRLSYPWLIPDEYQNGVLYDGALAPALLGALESPTAPDGLAAAMTRYSWDVLTAVYDTRFEQLADLQDLARA